MSYCDRDTAVSHSTYYTRGEPTSFSVCLWCGGLIEYSRLVRRPHEPYESARTLRTQIHITTPSASDPEGR